MWPFKKKEIKKEEENFMPTHIWYDSPAMVLDMWYIKDDALYVMIKYQGKFSNAYFTTFAYEGNLWEINKCH